MLHTDFQILQFTNKSQIFYKKIKIYGNEKIFLIFTIIYVCKNVLITDNE